MTREILATVCGSALLANPVVSAPVVVDSKEAILEAARAAKPGTVIQIKAGTYPGGIHLSGLAGTEANPIVIESKSSEVRATFHAENAGRSAIRLSGCSHVTLRDLSVVGFPINGINADDGGDEERLSVGLRFEGLSISKIGPRGNHDGLKLSGIREFAVSGCVFEGWGGSAIDMVGCHEGNILKCHFEGIEGFSQANGVQMKGGSSGILVARSFFRRAGQRAINLGGSTGLPYFRPADATWEARDIEVGGNLFVGSLAPIAWVGIDGGYVHHNTIYRPEKWIARILQENNAPRFGQCRNGRFEKNLVFFDERVRTFVNVGANTEPDTFTFRDNAWFDANDPKGGPSGLPGKVSGNLVGIDPPVFGGSKAALESWDPQLEGFGPEGFLSKERE